MNDNTGGNAWQRLAHKVTGLWREPAPSDFAVIAAASLEHEKQALLAPYQPNVRPSQKEAQLAIWESEGGMSAGPLPKPRPSSVKRRRSNYSP